MTRPLEAVLKASKRCSQLVVEFRADEATGGCPQNEQRLLVIGSPGG